MEFASSRQPSKEWVLWLDAWVRDMRVQGDTEETIRFWWYQISHLAITSGKTPEQITSKDIIAWLNRGIGNNAMRSGCNAANAFFKWAKRTGRITENPMELVPQVKRDKHKQRPASDDAADKGLGSPDKRVRLMVMLANDAGLRRHEIAVARTDDVIDDLAGRSLIVHGKGNKDRMVPLSDELAAEISQCPEGWLFPGHCDGHICADTVYRLVKQATGCTPHSFRRKFATDLWKATGDAVKVQEILGHESLATTQAYIFSTAEDLRMAVDALTRYRSQKIVGQTRPERLLAAYNVPEPLIRLVVNTAQAD